MHARKLLPFVPSVALALAALAPAAAETDVPSPAQVVPQRLIETMGGTAAAGPAVDVELIATLSHGGETGPVQWTVLERSSDETGDIVARGQGASLGASLRPGDYVAHIALAGTSIVRTFAVSDQGGPAPFALEIGGMSLAASSAGEPLGTTDAVEFTIYDTDGERKAIRRGVAPDETVVLPAGVYRAVVRYGEHNALTGADIRVRPGEVTHATLGVSGAPVRLSLVREPGARAALAAVSWRVFDDGGKPIMESDEPSPALVLAPGAYTAEALHDGWTGVHRFEVKSGEPLDLKLPVDG